MDTNKKRILVVDDEAMICEIVSKSLRSKGFEVETAGNGQAAVDLVNGKGKSYDLVICDMRMPSLDGRGLLKFIKSNCPNTRFIAMSGFWEFSHQNLKNLGAESFLSKPFSVTELLKLVGAE